MVPAGARAPVFLHESDGGLIAGFTSRFVEGAVGRAHGFVPGYDASVAPSFDMLVDEIAARPPAQ
jgi:hypothetical protein